MNPIRNIISASVAVKQALLENDTMIARIEEVIEVITDAFRNGNKVLFCGNGGSAADAQHLAAEFSGRFYSDRNPLPSEALHCNTSYLTAVANDYGYEQVYSRMVKGLGKPGDVLIGLSTSGNSANIINALNEAAALNMTTVAFTGSDGGKMKSLATFLLNVPSTDTPRIQEAHIMIGHIICQQVEEKLFSTNDTGSDKI